MEIKPKKGYKGSARELRNKAAKEDTKTRAKKFKKAISQKDLDRFCWGRVLKVHEVGDIAVVEYAERKVVNTAVTRFETGKSGFHPFIAGRDCSESYGSLEKAVLGAIVKRHLGENQWAFLHAIFRALGIESAPKKRRR